MPRFFLLCGLAAVTLGSAACGSANPAGPSAAPAGAMTIDVVAINGANSFTPNPAIIPRGRNVVWHNADTTTHRILLDDGTWDTGDISPGRFSSATILFGSGRYHCTIHPEMVGTISSAR